MPNASQQRHTSFVPEAFLTADEIVVKVSDLLYDYLPPASGIDPVDAVRDIVDIVDGPAGVAAFLEDAMHPGRVDARDVVVQLHDALEMASIDPRQTISRLVEVMETPLAVEVYDREMQRREPRDADTWH
ncbi:MAG: hypothetical protein ACTHLT_00545 [Devosia sp.]